MEFQNGVNDLSVVKILFEQIPSHGLSLDITDDAWFPDGEIKRTGKVEAQISLKIKHHELVVNGRVQCSVKWVCDRCLGKYKAELHNDFSLTIELQLEDDSAVFEAEHACSEQEMDVQYVREPELDVFKLLRQQILLAVPAKRICRKACKGLCLRCGNNLNEGGCSCSEEDNSSPFKVLAALKE